MLGHYYRINQVAGVSLDIGSDGSVLINVCLVQAEGNQLSLVKKITSLHSVEEIIKNIPGKTPVALNISGKGVFYKTIEKVDKIDPASFSKLLPNANADDFYIQNFVSGSYSHITLIRKSDADRWFGQFNRSELRLLMAGTGPFAVINIIDQLNFYDGDLILNGHTISRDGQGNWISYKYDRSARYQYPVKLASENIDEALVIPYAAAFQLILVNQVDAVHLHVPSLEDLLSKKLDENRLKVQGVLILVIFFSVLIVNYATFSWLRASNAKLDAAVAFNSQNTDSLSRVEDIVKNKEASLKALGWDGGNNKSSQIDQVAALLPPGITISEIGVNPIDQAGSRTQKSLVFYIRKMQVTGMSDQIIPVNEWIARIKTKRWVKNVQLDSYAFDGEHNIGRFVLTIDY